MHEMRHLTFTNYKLLARLSTRIEEFIHVRRPVSTDASADHFGIALLVFGLKKLPELGKGIGEGIRGFKSAMKAEEEKPASAATIVTNDQNTTKG